MMSTTNKMIFGTHDDHDIPSNILEVPVAQMVANHATVENANLQHYVANISKP